MQRHRRSPTTCLATLRHLLICTAFPTKEAHPHSSLASIQESEALTLRKIERAKDQYSNVSCTFPFSMTDQMAEQVHIEDENVGPKAPLNDEKVGPKAPLNDENVGPKPPPPPIPPRRPKKTLSATEKVAQQGKRIRRQKAELISLKADYVAAIQQTTTDRQDLLDQLDAGRALLDDARATSASEICDLLVEVKSIKEALKAQEERNENLESAAVLLKTELAKNENANADLHSRLKQTELHFKWQLPPRAGRLQLGFTLRLAYISYLFPSLM